MSKQKQYDFIIAGMGCAGLSLAMQLKNSPVSFQHVLLVDKSLKNENDRTWCFWTKEKNTWYEKIISKKWNHFLFKSNDFEKQLELDPYEYCMIRGLDFYTHCLTELNKDKRFQIVTEDITEISSLEKSAILKTKNQQYSSKYIFNSAFRNLDIRPKHVDFVQHFKGWLIETPQEVFDETCPTFMDFTVNQYDDCRFIYVIPYSKCKALIEYTGFSPNALADDDYDREILNYIKTKLKINSYKIIETEKGIIPMTENEFINPFGNRIINIGTAGGSSKPSTGYTFYFIQKNTQNIISQMLLNKGIVAPKQKARFLLYDKILLDVLNKKGVAAEKLFSVLFQKNITKNLLAFLNEESTVFEDLAILNSVPKKTFASSAIKKIINGKS